VQENSEQFICNCPDYELRGETCKHGYAVEFHLRRETTPDGTVVETCAARVTYAQNWPATEHALYIDHEDHVWISSSDNAERQVLKFTRDGQYAYDPDQPLPRQMQAVHCINQSSDGLLYVCDRGSNRLQVFQRDGTFVADGGNHRV
jgi:hypothetical protein